MVPASRPTAATSAAGPTRDNGPGTIRIGAMTRPRGAGRGGMRRRSPLGFDGAWGRIGILPHAPKPLLSRPQGRSGPAALRLTLPQPDDPVHVQRLAAEVLEPRHH